MSTVSSVLRMNQVLAVTNTRQTQAGMEKAYISPSTLVTLWATSRELQNCY